MAMITCTECGKSMSDAAPNCPSCGKPNRPNFLKSERKVSLPLGAGIFLLPVVFSWFTLRSGHTTLSRVLSFVWLGVALLVLVADPKSSSSDGLRPSAFSKNSQQQTASASAVDIRLLLSEYKSNEVAADNAYKGTLVQTSGLIGDIKKDILDNLYITLGTGKQFEIPQVQAFFSNSASKQLGQLSQGQRITVTCRIEGLMMNVLGKDCVIN